MLYSCAKANFQTLADTTSILKTSGRSNETDDTKLDISQPKNQRELKIASSMYVVVISCFYSTIPLKT